MKGWKLLFDVSNDSDMNTLSTGLVVLMDSARFGCVFGNAAVMAVNNRQTCVLKEH
jgi:hypothetical protein